MKTLDYDWNGKKVLVTGASGFKGSWLCATLLGLGARVYGTIRNQVDPLSAYSVLGLDKRMVNSHAEVDDRQSIYDLINTTEPDVIFHLAAKALVPVSLRDPRRTFEVNVMGTSNIIEACRRLKVCSRLLICSTDHVFGHRAPPHPKPPKKWEGYDEKSKVSYAGPYDTSKASMELLVRGYHYTYWEELPAICITRCANVFGYGDVNQRRIIPLFVRSAISDHKLHLRFKKSGRQFIHVTDAVAGYIRAIAFMNEGDIKTKTAEERPSKRSPFTPTFHFAIEKYDGTGEPFIRMEAVGNIVATEFGAKIDKTGMVNYPRNENPVQALNCSYTRSALRWKTRTSFGDGIRALGGWYRLQSDESALKRLCEEDVQRILSCLND